LPDYPITQLPDSAARFRHARAVDVALAPVFEEPAVERARRVLVAAAFVYLAQDVEAAHEFDRIDHAIDACTDDRLEALRGGRVVEGAPRLRGGRRVLVGREQQAGCGQTRGGTLIAAPRRGRRSIERLQRGGRSPPVFLQPSGVHESLVAPSRLAVFLKRFGD